MATIWLVVLLFALFQIKHFVVDFLFQPPYMYLNKGNLRHPGGYVHAGLHALITFDIFCILILTIQAAGISLTGEASLLLGICFFEFVTHYMIDWGKVNICKKYKWTATTHNEFWYMVGLDQLLHQVVYIIMIATLIYHV